MTKRIKEVPPVPEVGDPCAMEKAYFKMMDSLYKSIGKVGEKIAAIFKKKKK